MALCLTTNMKFVMSILVFSHCLAQKLCSKAAPHSISKLLHEYSSLRTVETNEQSIILTSRKICRLRGGGNAKRMREEAEFRLYVLGGNTADDMFTNVVETYEIGSSISNQNRWRTATLMPYVAAGCCSVRVCTSVRL